SVLHWRIGIISLPLWGRAGWGLMPNEHFVVPPHWEWYILLYFFFAGISGGAFVIGTMLRLWGSPADKAASRLAFIISFPLLLICPIQLTLDLGQPLRFWHMLVDSTAGTPVFKAYSPMSLGALFLASGLSGGAASILLLNRRGRGAAVTGGKLVEADRYFIILELVLIALFLITLGGLVSKVMGGGWIILWLIVLIATLVPL